MDSKLRAKPAAFFLTTALALILAGGSTSAALASTWHDSLPSALAEARSKDRLILVDLWAEWCGWCQILDKEVFSTDLFQGFAKDYVLLRLNVDLDPAGQDMARRFLVDKLPIMLIVSPEMSLAGQVPGYADANRYVDMLKEQVAIYDRLLANYQKALPGDDLEKLRAVAEVLHRRGDGARSAKLYRRLLEAGWEEPRGKGFLEYMMADALRLTKEFDEARQLAAKGRKVAVEAKNDQLLEAIDLLSIQLATEQDDCPRRVAAMEGFLRHHPKSDYASEVRSSLVQLQSSGKGCS